QYKILPPDKPVVGVVGKEAILPCQLQVHVIPERLSVRWTFARSSGTVPVAAYDGRNGHHLASESESYQGRTGFFQAEFSQGNLSLHLKPVLLSDSGQYVCSVAFASWYDEVVVDLDVGAKGDEVSLSLDGHQDQGVALSCKSQGWFPAPEVVWLDSEGQARKEKAATRTTRAPSGLFTVVTSMTLGPGSDKEVSCRVTNHLLNTRSESRVLISGAFFPSTSPWMTATLVLLFLSAALGAALGYQLKR
ncbi:BT3A2 protein, partial [Rhinopomastus cyanomelas]|nr:BT3A2 protein [Rhinopomastus cyanomelas]